MPTDHRRGRGGEAGFCEAADLDPRDAVRAIAACERVGMALALGENNRFWPNMLEMQRIVASGELGEPMHIEGHTSNENSGGSLARGATWLRSRRAAG